MAEMFGEMALIAEAENERDLRDGKGGIGQQQPGAGDATLDQKAMRRHSGTLLEGMGEMMERRSGDGGQIRQGDVLSQMFPM